MNNTQKVLKNQHICEQATPNLGITQSSGLERQYARNPLTHVDFLLFNQMDKHPVLAIEVDGTGFHEAGSKQAERDMKKNSILEKCGVPLLRLRTDGSGEKEKIKNALKGE